MSSKDHSDKASEKNIDFWEMKLFMGIMYGVALGVSLYMFGMYYPKLNIMIIGIIASGFGEIYFISNDVTEWWKQK